MCKKVTRNIGSLMPRYIWYPLGSYSLSSQHPFKADLESTADESARLDQVIALIKHDIGIHHNSISYVSLYAPLNEIDLLLQCS